MIWRIDLFGGLHAYSGDHTITRFQTYKTGALLAYLAYFKGRQHSREDLINILWPDVDPTAARNRLSQALVWLRPRLEPTEADRNSVLDTDRHYIGLHVDAVQTDASQMEVALQSASNGFPREQIDLLRSALDLYRSELLTGFYEDWIFPERERYAQLNLTILRRLIGLYEEVQEPERALDFARRALIADPLIEEVHRDLIRLLARSGQPAAALRQFHELKKILAEQLGEAPSAETNAVIEAIRQDSSPVPPLSLPKRRTTPLKIPVPLTRFFGRTEEIARAQQIIVSDRERLVTLIGPGGCGKTRLAIEIVSQLKSDYNKDIWFVPLVDIQDAHRIPYAIADVIRTLTPSPLPIMEQVTEWLAWHPSLLVLDNLEHLIDGAVPLIQELLERVPGLTILTTSRQCLGIEGEREIPVQPFPLPADLIVNDPIKEIDLESLMRCESVQLFVDRVQAVYPAFRLDTHNAQIVAQLCNRLEGIPLATELCAAWAQTLTPTQMLEELSRPFDLLVSRRREVPLRHRSLRAAIEYSYQQLSPALQQFFTRLSVFRNGWTLEAAEAICLEPSDEEDRQRKTRVRDLLTNLRERSLVSAEEMGAAMRFRMLETLREFAEEQHPVATDSDRLSICHEHARFFMHLVESVETSLTGPGQVDQINRLSAEHDNLRAALTWTIETGDAETGLRLAGAMTPFWDACGLLGEGQHWLTEVLNLSPANANSQELRLMRAKALTARGNLARNQGNFLGIDAAMQEALQIWRECNSEKGTAETLQILATMAYSHDDSKTARTYLHEGLILARRLQDQLLMALALHNLGNIALANQQWKKAFSYYTDSLALYRAEGNRSRSARILNNLGLVARYQGNYKTALIILHEALETSRELSDRSGLAMTSLNLATINRLEGHFTSAGSFLDEAAHHAAEAGEQRLLPWCVRERGYLLCAQGDYERGIRLVGAAENQRRTIGITFKPADPSELEHLLSLARVALGDERCMGIWAVGNSLSPSSVYAEALHLSFPPPLFK